VPSFPIIDAHVHLYDPGEVSYGWMKPIPALDRAHGIADFDAARGAVAVDKFVFVEVAADSGQHMREANFAARLARGDARLGALVVHAPLEKGARVEEDLAAFAGMARVKGVRRLIQGEVDPGICLEPDFAEGIERLKPFGFSFDICVKSFGLAYGLELARRHPDVRFILDHIGKPDIRRGLIEPWRSQIRAMAALPNVTVKLSGVITETHPERRTLDVIRPYVLDVVDAFGFERVMFGGDWPVSETTHRYDRWVAMLDAILADASEGEMRKLYRESAERVYRL